MHAPSDSERRRFRRIARGLSLFAAVCLLAGIVSLVGCQRRFIYMCMPYSANVMSTLPPRTIGIEYHADGRKCEAFYVKPTKSPDTPPDRLWVMFGGNGSLALWWVNYINDAPDPRAGFYLIDYPGYGLNEGQPSRNSINENSLAAFDALAARFNMTRAELASRTSLMCHSLGAAAGLELAVKLEPAPKKIILFAPFTSLYDMARKITFWPVCCMVLDRFDNRARLNELAARPTRPEVHIFHGSYDGLVPIDMGRELAAAHPEWIMFHEVEKLDHVWVIASSKYIWQPMMKP